MSNCSLPQLPIIKRCVDVALEGRIYPALSEQEREELAVRIIDSEMRNECQAGTILNEWIKTHPIRAGAARVLRWFKS